jgi:hypothetical protein
MNRKLRIKLLEKVAQATPPTTQPAQPAATVPALPPPPAVPGMLLVNRKREYNGPTVNLFGTLTKMLNDAMHFASQGKDNFQKIIDRVLDRTSTGDQKNVSTVAQMFYDTFLNKGSLYGRKVTPNEIHTWADAMLGNGQFRALTGLNPNISSKLGYNLQDRLMQTLNSIKSNNPTVLR